MQAVVYDGPRQFTVREVATPDPGPGEVLVRVIQTGVCGTDLHLHDGQFMAVYPMTPGHETVGIVERLGDAVDALHVGDQVAVNPSASCGRCGYCREGRPLLCRELTGIGSSRPGAFAEFVVAPEAQVFSAAGMDPDVAVFIEPTSCVMHGMDRLRVTPGSSALVVGAGPTGLLLAELIAAAGAVHVTVAEIAAFKLETAARLGIDRTFLMDRADLPGDVARLRELAGPGQDFGFDIVVDATGVAAVEEACVSLARNGGTVLFYGVADEHARIRISPYEVFRRELTLLGSFAEINSFPAAIAALRSGRARTSGIITHRFNLEDYSAALDALRGDPTAHKVVVQV
ncbi:MAG: zinc-dependent alcohol dehydrogenase family protein [Candidatus Limnocylindrales bacterium]